MKQMFPPKQSSNKEQPKLQKKKISFEERVVAFYLITIKYFFFNSS
jgi:hypothetical protein